MCGLETRLGQEFMELTPRNLKGVSDDIKKLCEKIDEQNELLKELTEILKKDN